MRLEVQPRSFRNCNRGVVTELPIEIEVRHVERNFFFPVRVNQCICHVFTAEMHVGHHVNQFNVLIEGDVAGGLCQLASLGGIAKCSAFMGAVVLRET
jgi:hypothetical protein